MDTVPFTADLPVMPPVEPMLAKAQAKVPDDPGVWSWSDLVETRYSATARALCCTVLR
jgi:hypothetical protein